MTMTVRRWDEPTAWNHFVASLPDGHFQQSWEWGEVAPNTARLPVRLAALDGEEMVGTMQALVQPLSRTGKAYLYVPRGPAVRDPGNGSLSALLEAARHVGAEVGAVGIRVEPNASACSPRWTQALQEAGLSPTFPPSQPRSAWVLEIDRDEESLLAGMKQKTRYNIRLASKKGVEVREGTLADLDSFLEIYRETAERDGFYIHSRSTYERMFRVLEATGHFRMLVACHGGVMIAAITLIRCGRTCWYMQGASSNRHRNLMPTYLLQWEGIRQARRWRCTVYDFRAVPDTLCEGHEMYGVYRFKEGFGGHHVTVMPTYSAPYAPLVFGAWQTAQRLRFRVDGWRRQRRGLPIRQSA